MRYRSKKDPGLVALTWGGIAIAFVPAILLLILPGNSRGLMIVGGLFLFMAIAFVAFLLSLTTAHVL